AFKRVVRDLEFDVAEIAIVTFLMAKAYGKPLRLLPAVMFGRFQHSYLVSLAGIRPKDLEGRRIAIRSSSVTTAAWIRGMLADDYGVDLGQVTWVTFEDAHVAEYRDPPGTERAPAGKTPLGMLLAGEVDAAVLADPVPQDERLKSVIPDPAAAAADWRRRKGAIQVNHLVCVKNSLQQAIVDEVFDLLSRSKKMADENSNSPYDASPFGLEANRRNLEVAIEYVYRQKLIPRRYTVDELFER
ncbi:MAG TPA: phosphate ABC transporter substrate-binding protein, partial [Burkholderiales bacterium]|nr:phosphate ABC transporter substrate-binding protein [Burkholderiales bacterium]